MSSTTPHLLQRERYLILGVLLVLAALAWGLLIWQAPMMDNQAMGLTMGMSTVLFIAIWTVMMVAMMFPAAAPMILMFGAVYAGKRQQEQVFVPTWILCQRLPLRLVIVRSGCISSRSGNRAGGSTVDVVHGEF